MKYKALVIINHDGVNYQVGDDLELSDAEAVNLLDLKAIEPSVKPFGKPVEKTALHSNSLGY